MTLQEHAVKLMVSIERAIAEHGTPNSFSFGELSTRPAVAAKAARLLDAEWCRAHGVSITDRRVVCVAR